MINVSDPPSEPNAPLSDDIVGVYVVVVVVEEVMFVAVVVFDCCVVDVEDALLVVVEVRLLPTLTCTLRSLTYAILSL